MGKGIALVLGLTALGLLATVCALGLGGLALAAQRVWARVFRR